MTTPEAAPSQAQASLDARSVPVLGLSQQMPYVTFAFLGITIGLFLIEMATQAGFGRDLLLQFNQRIMGTEIFNIMSEAGYGNDPLMMFGARIEPLVYLGQYWRLLTATFLHPFWWLLAVNMYSLYNIGRTVEHFFGHGRFLALFLLGAVGGNILGLLVSDRPMIGAATAIGALMAGYMVFVYRNPVLYGSGYRSALQGILVTLGINIVIWLFPRMDMWSVVGGMLVGIAFAWTTTPMYKLVVEWQTGSGEEPGTVKRAFFVNENTAPKVWLTGILVSVVLLIILLIAQFTAG